MKSIRSVLAVTAVLFAMSLLTMTAFGHSSGSSSSGGMGMMSGNGNNHSAMHDMMHGMDTLSEEEQGEMAAACLEMMRQGGPDNMGPEGDNPGEMMR